MGWRAAEWARPLITLCCVSLKILHIYLTPKISLHQIQDAKIGLGQNTLIAVITDIEIFFTYHGNESIRNIYYTFKRVCIYVKNSCSLVSLCQLQLREYICVCKNGFVSINTTQSLPNIDCKKFLKDKRKRQRKCKEYVKISGRKFWTISSPGIPTGVVISINFYLERKNCRST